MDRFSRIERLLGAQAVSVLRGSRVAVVGLGAVGSFAVEGLARSGIGFLRLADFDRVELSNINRQLFALQSTVGMPKAVVAVERVREINPECRTEGLVLRVDKDTARAFLEPRPDILVDAIDLLASKADLLEAAWRMGIPVVSSMGAALHRDPLSVRIGDLFDTSVCPLAKRLRTEMKRRGVGRGIVCVYSTEHVERVDDAGLGLSGCSVSAAPGETGGSRSPLGSLASIPGIFGLTIAQTVIDILLGKPAEPVHHGLFL